MADRTAAERQRRYRERKRAEQQKAAPQRYASPVTAPVTRDAVTSPPAAEVMVEFGPRGRWMWQQVTGEGPPLRPTERVTLAEACRTADRLDVLDRILRGDEDAWVRLHSANEDGSIVKVVLNNALAEARQQQTTLARLLAELRQSRGGGVGKATAKPASSGGGGVAGVTNLAARIAAKRGSQTAG
ncbi:hypothetical protein ACIA59_10570 [Micromonospora haikouensis]|uniref:hypothetical protein n=1 Tax=Micromonospora haikouensis TaxID=686309 RepID=UPI00379059F2